MIFLLLDVRRDARASTTCRCTHWARALDGVDEKIVLTKSDKLSNNQLAASRRAIAQELEIDDAQTSSPRRSSPRKESTRSGAR